jgi:hypothetical protein
MIGDAEADDASAYDHDLRAVSHPHPLPLKLVSGRIQ